MGYLRPKSGLRKKNIYFGVESKMATKHEFYLFFIKIIDKKHKKLYSENIKFFSIFGNFKDVAYESI